MREGCATNNIKMEKHESSDSEESRESEGSSESSSDESETHDWIWEKLAIISCYNDKFSSLDLFKSYIRSHIDSQSNKLFELIMNDVLEGEKYDIPLEKAIRFAIKTNELLIIDAVDKCNENEEDEDSDDWFWCRLSELGGDLNCRWITGKPCNCEKHNGANMLDTIGFFIKLFIDMGKDELIEEIESDIEKINSDEISLNDAIDQAVKDHEEEILTAFREARKTIDACGSWNKNIFWQ